MWKEKKKEKFEQRKKGFKPPQFKNQSSIFKPNHRTQSNFQYNFPSCSGNKPAKLVARKPREPWKGVSSVGDAEMSIYSGTVLIGRKLIRLPTLYNKLQ